ncbi:conserved membrane hypothetical protein [Desulfovibrionales bacterium]
MTFGVFPVNRPILDPGGDLVMNLYVMPDQFLILISVLFAFLATCRFALNLGIIDRPLALGLSFGAVTGRWQEGLGITIFYELIWLDQFSAGTFVPPNSVLSTCLALGLTEYFGLVEARTIVLPLIIGIPMALIGARLEICQRRWQDSGYNALVRWARKSHRTISDVGSPERLIVISLLQIFGCNLVFFGVVLLTCIGILDYLKILDGLLALHLPLEWGHLWFLATIGPLLSLRIWSFYATVVVGITLIVLLGILCRT